MVQLVKNLPAHAEDEASTPGLGRSPGVGNGNLLQYSCLENSTDRGAWQVYDPNGHKEEDTSEPLNTAQL